MPLLWAQVRFKNETERHIVPVKDIKEKNQKNPEETIPFHPSHERDFHNDEWYFVKWICNEKDCEKNDFGKHRHSYKAAILHLGGTF